jgi:hypothetical protein
MALLLADAQHGNGPVVAEPAAVRRRPGLIFVFLFIVGLLLPIMVMVGPIRLSPYRIVLILAFLPILYAIATGAWRLRMPDVFIILYALWPGLAIFWHHGAANGLEPAGIHVIESFGAYGLARCYIRSLEDFERVLRAFFISLLVLIPFAVYEAVTYRIILWDIAGMVSKTFSGANREFRLGLQRVHGPFQHPILYGVYCASLLGLLVLTVRRGAFGQPLLRFMVVGVATFLSLSSGPLVAFMVQVAMLCWMLATHYVPYRWWIFMAGGATSFFVVDALSNRTPFEVLISYATFNQANAYNRIHIWNFGMAEVERYPLLGIGFNEWENAFWMSQSMDNFWLYNAVRFGLPALLFLALAILAAMLMIGRLKRLTPAERNVRTGWAISIAGLIIAGGTVHFWNAVYSHFFLLLGSTMWLLDAHTRRPAQPASSAGDTLGAGGPMASPPRRTPRVLVTPPARVLRPDPNRK